MGLICGIVGLPNVGKSTIFNALTSSGSVTSNYPFCTIEPNRGAVPVPDDRLTRIARITGHAKVTPTTLEFLDIAGLIKGASRGEGLGNQFLGQIRNVDAIVHIVRCFDDDRVVHVDGSINPQRDIEVVNTELILADLDSLNNRLMKSKKTAKSGDKKIFQEIAIYEQVENHLNQGLPVRGFQCKDDDGWDMIRDLQLLTARPVVYVGNVNEEGMKGDNRYLEIVKGVAEEEKAGMVTICGEVESEIREFTEKERKELLRELGVQESGLEQLVKISYELLGLITFYTTAGEELRAWTLKKGAKALAAAGKIHSDMEKGFIRAEVISFQDFISHGSLVRAREEGAVRKEGKGYPVRDGDIILFRFNV